MLIVANYSAAFLSEVGHRLMEIVTLFCEGPDPLLPTSGEGAPGDTAPTRG